MHDPSKRRAEPAWYDLETVDAMLKAGRWLYVLFRCHQAAEKMLKSVIVQRTGELPPRIHPLVRLAELASVATDERQIDFLRELSGYYIRSRYPEEAADLSFDVKQQKAQRILSQSRHFIQWLSSILQ